MVKKILIFEKMVFEKKLNFKNSEKMVFKKWKKKWFFKN